MRLGRAVVAAEQLAQAPVDQRGVRPRVLGLRLVQRDLAADLTEEVLVTLAACHVCARGRSGEGLIAGYRLLHARGGGGLSSSAFLSKPPPLPPPFPPAHVRRWRRGGRSARDLRAARAADEHLTPGRLGGPAEGLLPPRRGRGRLPRGGLRQAGRHGLAHGHRVLHQLHGLLRKLRGERESGEFRKASLPAGVAPPFLLLNSVGEPRQGDRGGDAAPGGSTPPFP